MKRIITYCTLGLFAFGTGMLLFGLNGQAYIDPSVTTYLIQAIAGVVVAVGAGIGIYIRRAKKKINKTINIDENKGKEVEADEIIVNTVEEQSEE